MIEMSQQIKAINIGKWTVGYSTRGDKTILSFEFPDKPPMNFAIPSDKVETIADALVSAKSDAQKLRKPH